MTFPGVEVGGMYRLRSGGRVSGALDRRLSRRAGDGCDGGPGRLLRRLFHDPVAGALDDDALDVAVDELALIDQEVAAGFFAAQHEHRHRELRLRERAEVLRVLIERAEILEARAHAARLRVLTCVE